MQPVENINPLLAELILDNSIICVFDNALRIVYGSKNFQLATGHNTEELAVKSLYDLKHPDQSNTIYDFITKTIEKNETWKGELQLRNNNNESIWLDTTIKPVNIKSEKKQYIATFLDITQRKHLIDSLKKRAHRQGLIAILGQLSLNNIPITDLLEQTLSVVCGSLNIRTGLILELAVSAENSLARATYNTAYLEAGKTTINIDKNSMLYYVLNSDHPVTSESLHDEQRFNIPDAFFRENTNSATCILIGDKKYPFGIFTLLSDQACKLNIDEVHFLQSICNILAEAINRQNMEVALRHERELSRKYLDVAEVVIVVLDKYENILLVNQHAATILGHPQTDLAGMNFIDTFIPEDIRSRVRSNYHKLLEHEVINDDLVEYHGNVTPIINKQNQSRFIKWKSSLLHNDQGEVISVLSAGEDITELLEYEEEQKRLEKQLNQAQKMEAVGMLAGGIAHDFNNILASILGFSDLALESLDSTDRKLHEYLTFIRNSGIKARDIIAQMQNINLQDESSKKPIILSALLKSTLKMLRSALPSSIDMNLDIDENMPAVHINAAKFNQLVMQLLINARNAINENGSIEIKLSKKPFDNAHCISCGESINDEYAVFQIKDTGPGITHDSMHEITSGNPKSTPQSGLAIINKIVHDSNGHILISSNQLDNNYKQQGTDIQVLFQFSHQDEYHKKTSKTDIDLSSIHNRHLMIVDDENSVASYLGELFRGTGFKVSVFCDAIEALSSFTKSPDSYDLIITDQTMPALTGDLLATKMLEKRPSLPIILCTGHSDIINQEKAQKIQIQGFLKKPVDSAELLHLVMSLLTENQS